VHQRGSAAGLSEQDRRELAAAWRGLTTYRERVDTERRARAAAAATDLVTDLVAVVTSQPDVIVEDALCLRVGPLLDEARQSPPDDRLGPGHLAPALIAAAAAAVEAALGQADAWHAPWRVLTAVAAILPYPHGEAAADTITSLRDTARDTRGRRVLPPAPPGPTVAGPVLWTRDRYGSRFAVTAPITTAEQPQRWYLWDIDACGHQAFTVYSAFYPTPDAALTAWQHGVGPTAATDTELSTVDDPWLLAELLPFEEGMLRAGGENVDQLAEYHRSKRLAEAVRQTLPRQGTRPDGDLDKTSVATEFTAWLRAHHTETLPKELDELTTELADSWCINNIDAVFATCSPHRVALFIPHVRNYYLDEFADQLIALLPEWIRWLTDLTAAPMELAQRCLPYAEGQPHPQLRTDNSIEPHYMARVTE
jgi:hypothetical protein